MKIKVSLSIGYSGGHKDEIEIDDEELEGMSDEEKNKYIEEIVIGWANNYIDIGWEIKE